MEKEKEGDVVNRPLDFKTENQHRVLSILITSLPTLLGNPVLKYPLVWSKERKEDICGRDHVRGRKKAAIP